MPGVKRALIWAALFAAFLLCGADELMERARQGDVASQEKLAAEFFFGKKRKGNLPLAYYWFRRAAKSGSASASYNMGMCLLKGWGCKKNVAGAFRAFETAMDKGVKKAAVRYAEMLFGGVEKDIFEEEELPEVPADPQRAMEMLRPLAENDTEAMGLLAKMLYRDVEKNGRELRQVLKRYVERAADAESELLLLYSACLRSGLGGGVPDAAAGAEILCRAAKKKHPDAIAQLAEMMLLGLGMPVNRSEALKLYEEAVKLGSSRAKTDVAQMKLAGVNMAHDPAGAFELLKEAAEKNYPPALCKLGDCYEFGIGTEPDIRQAMYNYHKAAELGSRLAAYRLGEHYRDGKKVPANAAVAFYFFNRAANAGHPGAMREAGKALLNGSGTERNESKALELLRRAASAGDREAAELLR